MNTIELFLMFLTYIVTGKGSKHCFSDSKQHTYNFGVKTGYEFARGNLTPYAECKPIQLYVVARYGQHVPGKKIVSEMNKLANLRDRIVDNHKNNLGELCDSDLENLKRWRLAEIINSNYVNTLTPNGITSLEQFAERIKKAFPTLFTPELTSNMSNYEFISSKTLRTKQSMEVFAKKLIGTKSQIVPTVPTNADMLLHSSKNCPAWVNEKKTTNYLQEYKKFKNGPEMQEVLVNVSRRLGFETKLKIIEMNAIYEMCRYERVFASISIWCAAFSTEEVEVLQYTSDLFYHYDSGAGRDINFKTACPLTKDLFEHFRKLEGSDYTKEPIGIFYFVHLRTLNNLLSALGIISKQLLLASNFKELKNRLWKTTYVLPFSANLVATYYKCDDAPDKVTFHVQEFIQPYNGCIQGICDWKYFRDEERARTAKECNMDFCKIQSKHSSSNKELLIKLVSESSSKSISNFNIILLIFLLVGFNKTFI